jgi:uncharacterized protein (TIGR00369 family)
MNRWKKLLDAAVSGQGSPPPCIVTLKIPGVDGWQQGRVWRQWQVDPAVFHERGAVFGGYLAALADSTLGLAVMTVLEDEEVFTTSDLRVSFFRPATGGVLRIEGRVVHRGRSMAHVEVDFSREDGKLVAKATATQVITARPPDGPS